MHVSVSSTSILPIVWMFRVLAPFGYFNVQVYLAETPTDCHFLPLLVYKSTKSLINSTYEKLTKPSMDRRD